jgi:hypothetical protein
MMPTPLPRMLHSLRTPYALALVVCLCLSAGNAYAESKAKWTFTPEKGFVDDAMAFDSTKRFAYVHTDSAEFLRIELISLDTLKKERSIEIKDANRVPQALHFVADGTRLLFIWMDSYEGKHGVMLFNTENGKLLKELKPGAPFRLIARDGKEVLLRAHEKADNKGGTKVTVSTYNPKTLRAGKVAKLTIAAGVSKSKPPLRLLYWGPGHLTMVGLQKGKYDRKKDMRLPDRALRYNLLSRKQEWALAPQDLVAWTRALNMRTNHPEQHRFLHVSDDRKTLHLVDAANTVSNLQTTGKWSLYEPKSLRQLEAATSSELYFSLTVDPVNAEAVARKKADIERMDLYVIDGSGKTKRLGQVKTNNRRFSWSVGANHFSYLEKLKGFGRGGKSVSLFPVE